ncbi:MAG: molybdate ABC transporter substrate-binding protein [Coriobacteriia bacterium]|nr:molybdate ABC transporter substrate-binding protein [Coriobacteriia bacterium]
MRRLFKLGTFAALVVLLVGALSACGQPAENTDTNADQANQSAAAPEAEKPAENKDAAQEEPAALEGEVAVQAAASLEKSLNDIIALFKEANPKVNIVPQYAGSGTLVEQIKNGAPADIFISANQAKMNDAEEAKVVIEGSRKDMLENELVLIVPKGNPNGVKGIEDLTGDNIKKVAIGEPESVPAGKYASQTFESKGLTDALQPKLVLGKDVTQTLTYVATNEADAGFVYKTDAMTQADNVEIVGAVDGHDPVTYPGALINTSGQDNPAAAAFFEYLGSDDAAKIFDQYGFKVIK